MMLKLELFLHDLAVALRSLARAKGLAITVVLTLALGIGANAAIFSLVRGVLLRPLVNRDERSLIYIRQSAPGIGVENANFSVPEIQDMRAGVKSLSAIGDFSTIGFTMVGLGDPREVRAGVVGGSYFEVMGLHPVLGRLLDMHDDGPKAAGAAVLTYRFWTTTLKSDPSVIGKEIRLGERSAAIVGVLEPSVPYPANTEIIANVVTSPHHLSATMVTGRVHRMTELFGRLAPGATLESANAELRTVYASMIRQHPEAYSQKGDNRIHAVLLRDQITSGARTILWVLLAASILVFIIACSNVANLILARSMGRKQRSPAPHSPRRKPSALRRRRDSWRPQCASNGRHSCSLRLALLRPRARTHHRLQHALGWRRTRHSRLRSPGVCPPPAFHQRLAGIRARERRSAHHRQHQPPPAYLRGHTDRRVLHAPGRRQHAHQNPPCIGSNADWLRHASRSRHERAGHVLRKNSGSDHQLLPGNHSPHQRTPRRGSRRSRHQRPLARCRQLRSRPRVHW